MSKIKIDKNLIIKTLIVISILSTCGFLLPFLVNNAQQIKYQDSFMFNGIWNTLKYSIEIILMLLFGFFIFLKNKINVKRIGLIFILIIFNLEFLNSFFIQLKNLIFYYNEVKTNYTLLIIPIIIITIIDIISGLLLKQNKSFLEMNRTLKVLTYIVLFFMLAYFISAIIAYSNEINNYNELIVSVENSHPSLVTSFKLNIYTNIFGIVKISVEFILTLLFSIIFFLKFKNIDKISYYILLSTFCLQCFNIAMNVLFMIILKISDLLSISVLIFTIISIISTTTTTILYFKRNYLTLPVQIE